MSKWIHGGTKIVATPGTPVQLTTSNIMAHAILIEALPENTKKVVVGGSNAVRAGVGGTSNPTNALKILGKPDSADLTPPSVEYGITNSAGGVLLSQFWIDAEVADEGVSWSYSQT